ncbi:hypothetical protein AB0H43_04100 [Hamadaea sp. NPDC050747]|uniref:hypothetical protein n=1 Tax=Hamadaea sp. NPDC050747 TaxID=3155789 RepID=UPI0033CE3F3E
MAVTAEAGLDTTPLAVASTRPELRAFTTGVLGRRRWNGWVGVVVLYAVATAAVAALLFAALALVALAAGDSARAIRDYTLLLSASTAACLVAAVFVWVAHVKRGDLEQLFRLHRFAAANGFDFAPEVKEPDLPGVVFQRGTLRRSAARLRRRGPRPLEVANYRAWIAQGRAGETLSWSYFALTLERRMPQIVLDARANGGRLLGSGRPGSPVTELGPPFGAAFRLVCPPEVEGWARSLFTPDIVARFVGPGPAVFSVEVVADRLFVYSRLRPLSCCDPQTWRWLSETADALYTRIEDLDDTAVAPITLGSAETPAGLAPPYAPLRRPFPVAAVVPFLVLAGVWAVALAA